MRRCNESGGASDLESFMRTGTQIKEHSVTGKVLVKYDIESHQFGFESHQFGLARCASNHIKFSV